VASFHLHGFGLKEAFLLRKAGDVREAFVYRHARKISNLAQDVLCLESHDQSNSCPIIVRAMLEGLFKLVAATKVPDAAVGIILSEVKTEIQKIEEWIKVLGNNDDFLKNTVNELSSFASNLRTQHSIKSKKNWNILECAKASDLGGVYRQDYFLFSKHTHATASGIIAQEYETVRDRVLRVVIFVVLCTAGHLVQVAETKTPQLHIDETSKLMEAAITFMNQKPTD
jgi:hypothetical protein